MSEREGSWWPFAVPAVIAVALVTTVIVFEGSNKDAEALTCPTNYRSNTARPWVPDVNNPVDKNDHIAPIRLPTDVVVCLYRGSGRAAPTTPLTGAKQLNGPFKAVVDTVAYLPRDKRTGVTECWTASSGSTASNYLLGLTYVDGTEWIAATDNHCATTPTTNGTFDSSTALAAKLRAAYRTGSWPAH